MNSFDKCEELMKKKRITKKDKCDFLATLPDIVFSMTGFEPIKCLPDAKAVAAFYSDEDIEELFNYWYYYFKGLKDKRRFEMEENGSK